MAAIRDEILLNIIKKSERYNRLNINVCSASILADELSISRSLASHYLNEMSDEAILFKILSRPVYFLHRQTIEENYDVRITQDFLSIDEFQQFLMHASGEGSVFTKLIGYDGSLMSIISQSTSALLYPPSGLPMIVYGEHGTGKSSFVSLLFDHGVNHHIFLENAELKHIILDDHAAQQKQKLCRIRELLKDHCRNGILCIQHAQHLDREMMQEVMIYIHRQKRKAGRNGFLLILCMEKNPANVFELEFLQQFPVLLHMPDMEERSLEEKEEILIRYLRKEEERTQKAVSISNTAFRAMCRHRYPLNCIDMQNTVTLACASAMDTKEKSLHIYTTHLPHVVADEMDLDKGHEDHMMISVKDFSVDHDITRMIAVFDEILRNFEQQKLQAFSIRDVVNRAYLIIKEYYDATMFRHLYVSHQMKSMEKMLERSLDDVTRSFHMTLPAHCSFVLARVIYLFSQRDESIRLWEIKHHEELQRCLHVMKEAYSDEDFMCSRISHLLLENFDIHMQEVNDLLLMIFLAFYGRGAQIRHYLGIIISHGYATASSITDAVNSLIGEYVFDAIDMPLDTGSEETVKKLQEYIQKYGVHKGAIVLVDMGSLETIGEQMAGSMSGAIGVINNVSTKMALQVGYDILQKKDMRDILKRASTQLENSYTIIDATKKQDVILFTSESGEATSRHILQLFQESLPVKLDIEMLAYDFSSLQKYGRECPVFEQYHVLFVAGTMDPRVDDINFIAVEDIITGNIQGGILERLNDFLSVEQIEQLNHQLMISFSLQNVMEHITILNPKTLMDIVVEAIDRMEQLFRLRLEGKEKIGLYLHVSCLIERLVTKNSVEPVFDLHLFEQEKEDFIKGVRICFVQIMEHYHVEVPINEILYLYEYIVKDEKEIKRYRGE